MPVAGVIVWAAVGLIGLFLPFRTAVFVLVFGTGAILPIAMLIARIRHEELLSNSNPLAKLMGACVFKFLIPACAFAVVAAYGLAIFGMATRRIVDHPVRAEASGAV